MNWYEEKKGQKGDKNDEERHDLSILRDGSSQRRFRDADEVEVKFDNGEKVREHWDGQSRWTRFAYQKKTKVVSAEIDPDHTVQLDRNNFNNSYVAEPMASRRTSSATYWLFVTQWLGQALAWWAVYGNERADIIRAW